MDYNKQAQESLKVIIGLGNPGSKYAKTRHNVGFRFVDELAYRYQGSWHRSTIMESCDIFLPGRSKPLLLIKPQTFMNSSGDVMPSLQKKGIKGEQVLVVHDELEKPFGHVSIKHGGSARGHNGLRSCIAMIGDGFWRMRIGIGRPTDNTSVADFVLHPFSTEQEQALSKIMEEAVALLFK